MKINVGPEARVVGNKRVQPNGTVGGLRELAGREVFIVVPTTTPRVSPTGADVVHEVREELVKNGQRALREFRALRRRYLAHEVPGTRRLVGAAPAELRPAIRKADRWVRATAERLERAAGRWLSQ